MKRTAERLVPNELLDSMQVAPSAEDLEPLKRLMLAVLDLAVSDFRTYAAVPTKRGKRLFADVDAWFSSSAAGPFEFETICDAIGRDPDYIRRGLRSSLNVDNRGMSHVRAA